MKENKAGCIEHKDGDGHHWVVPNEPKSPVPQVDVWWSRVSKMFNGKRLMAESLVLRQVNTENDNADVIVLTLGQVYDLIDALNKAVEKP